MDKVDVLRGRTLVAVAVAAIAVVGILVVVLLRGAQQVSAPDDPGVTARRFGASESEESRYQGSATLPDDPAVWLAVLRQERKVVIREVGQPTPIAELEVESLGELSPEEQMTLLEGFQQVSTSAQESKRSLLVGSQDPRFTVELADLEISIDGAEAKARAVMEGSYLLLPSTTKALPSAILRHPHLHIVCCSGGFRNGIQFNTWIIVDLRKNGRFAQSMDNYARLRRMEIRDMAQEFNSYPEDERRRMVQGESGLTEAMRGLWSKMRAKNIRVENLVAYEQ